MTEVTFVTGRSGGGVGSIIYSLDENFSGNLSLPEKSPKTVYLSREHLKKEEKSTKSDNGPTDRPTDRQTDRPTDIVNYRVACTRLKTKTCDSFTGI